MDKLYTSCIFAIIMFALLLAIASGVSADASSGHPASVRTTQYYQRLSELGGVALAAYAKEPPIIDGDISDWGSVGAPSVHIPAHIGQILGFKDYGGKNDLSATFRAAWDFSYLYLGFNVSDNTHHIVAGKRLWKGDSIQVAFDPLRNRTGGGFDENVYEYGFGCRGNGIERWAWQLGAKMCGSINDIKIAAKPTTYGLVCEIAFPWETLTPLTPSPGRAFGFTFLVNDNDGSGRRGWIEWTPGIGSCKDPASYGTMLLASPDDATLSLITDSVEYIGTTSLRGRCFILLPETFAPQPLLCSRQRDPPGRRVPALQKSFLNEQSISARP